MSGGKKKCLYKTEMCRQFEENGFCKYQNRCQFAHSEEEMRCINRHPRYKTEICKSFWDNGQCAYGKRCCFIHGEVDFLLSLTFLDNRVLKYLKINGYNFNTDFVNNTRMNLINNDFNTCIKSINDDKEERFMNLIDKNMDMNKSDESKCLLKSEIFDKNVKSELFNIDRCIKGESINKKNDALTDENVKDRNDMIGRRMTDNVIKSNINNSKNNNIIDNNIIIDCSINDNNIIDNNTIIDCTIIDNNIIDCSIKNNIKDNSLYYNNNLYYKDDNIRFTNIDNYKSNIKKDKETIEYTDNVIKKYNIIKYYENDKFHFNNVIKNIIKSNYEYEFNDTKFELNSFWYENEYEFWGGKSPFYLRKFNRNRYGKIVGNKNMEEYFKMKYLFESE